MDNEERGGDGLGGNKMEEFCIRAGFLPQSDGGGGEGCAHSSQVSIHTLVNIFLKEKGNPKQHLKTSQN